MLPPTEYQISFIIVCNNFGFRFFPYEIIYPCDGQSVQLPSIGIFFSSPVLDHYTHSNRMVFLARGKWESSSPFFWNENALDDQNLLFWWISRVVFIPWLPSQQCFLLWMPFVFSTSNQILLPQHVFQL